jgi:nitroreductase
MSRHADHPIDAQFLNRHSPRAFTDEVIAEEELLTLLEAARWAPSASNVQPLRMVWARRPGPDFDAFAGVLVPGNRVWAERASALVAIVSATENLRDGVASPHPSHAFDAGAGWMSLALQAHLRGWVAHAMAGIDVAAASELIGLPKAHVLHVVVAIGRQGAPDTLPEAHRPREVPNGRKPLSEIAFAGRF